MFARVWEFVKHRFRSKDKYAIHSPFIYDFIVNVLPDAASPKCKAIETLRQELVRSRELLEVRDYGAGFLGKKSAYYCRPLGDIARTSACDYKTGKLLHRICAKYQPNTCLELGTNLGVSTLYQTTALSDASRFISVEGSVALYAIAQKNLARFAQYPELICTDFDSFLRDFHTPLDYVYIDGNHAYEPTLRYIDALIPLCEPYSVIILDDIYWSAGMTKAWREIILRAEVSLSVDLYALGLLFLKRPQAKEHFSIAF